MGRSVAGGQTRCKLNQPGRSPPRDREHATPSARTQIDRSVPCADIRNQHKKNGAIIDWHRLFAAPSGARSSLRLIAAPPGVIASSIHFLTQSNRTVLKMLTANSTGRRVGLKTLHEKGDRLRAGAAIFGDGLIGRTFEK